MCFEMIALLLAACLFRQHGAVTPITFGNGLQASIVVMPEEEGTDGATAYLQFPQVGRAKKPITDCSTWSDVNWFNRRDGSIVLLIEEYRFISAHTITTTGKVYRHDEPWYSDAWIVKLYRTGARVAYSVHANSEVARNVGVKQPNDNDLVTVGFDWAPKRMKWVPIVLGYESR